MMPRKGPMLAGSEPALPRLASTYKPAGQHDGQHDQPQLGPPPGREPVGGVDDHGF